MRILLLGNTGQVGWELNRTLLTVGDLIALDYPQIDMSDPNSIRMVMRETNPDLVVNATAYTNVDKAESEPELAMAINGIGPGILAEEAKRINAGLIHYSTDYVFDGTKGSPYTEEDIPNPINMYGKTKLAGEQAIRAVDGIYLIFRTSWVYSLRRPCFVTKVLEWAKTKEVMRIVDDQVSSPTWSRMLAEATAQVVSQVRGNLQYSFSRENRIYNLTSTGFCSRYEWALEIIRLYSSNEECQVKKVYSAKSTDFLSSTIRPSSSMLDVQKISQFNIALPHWKTALAFCLLNK